MHGSGYFCAKKTPADHISVKDRGLLLLDFNQVWGDKTTISFYRVSVPFQIFNYPRGQVFAHVCLNQGVDIGVQAHPLPAFFIKRKVRKIMKQTVKTSRAAGQLEKMFRELNKHYFAGKLPEPIISLKKTPSAYGHITCSKVWQAGGENKYEINISSATLDRPIEETASTLLHEMVHEHCMETGIKDTSNNGVYHNRRFKEQAETHGLTVDHHEKYGWTITSPSEELLDFIIFQGWQDIQMGERLAWSDMAGTGAGSKAPGSSQTGAPKPPKAKSSTRRWVCPKCGTIIRSTKEVRVICADCMELFVKAD